MTLSQSVGIDRDAYSRAFPTYPSRIILILLSHISGKIINNTMSRVTGVHIGSHLFDHSVYSLCGLSKNSSVCQFNK